MEMESDGLGSVDQSKVVDLACSYLEVAPHPIKFSFFWLSDFLFDSMKSNPKFSLKKASEAFHLLESQAVFMIRFPYSTHSSIISFNSGILQRVDDSDLWSIFNQLFLEMGFESGRDGFNVRKHGSTKQTLLRIGRDCLLAKVECSMISSIWKGVSEAGVQVSLAELAHFRKGHIGSVQRAIDEFVIQKLNGDCTKEHLVRIFFHWPDAQDWQSGFQDPFVSCQLQCERELEKVQLSQNELLQQLLHENQQRLRRLRDENEAQISRLLRESELRVSRLLKESEARLVLIQAEHKGKLERVATETFEPKNTMLDKDKTNVEKTAKEKMEETARSRMFMPSALPAIPEYRKYRRIWHGGWRTIQSSF